MFLSVEDMFVVSSKSRAKMYVVAIAAEAFSFIRNDFDGALLHLFQYPRIRKYHADKYKSNWRMCLSAFYTMFIKCELEAKNQLSTIKSVNFTVMPLYREWASDPYSLAAIWKIEEPDSFFTERTGIGSDIKNEKRRMEFLAGRFLLKYLKEDFPLLNIKPDIHDKPRIDNNDYYFSISHSWPYVAAVVSPYVEAGIDIQCWHPRMQALQNKFLSKAEQRHFHNDPQLITLAWSAKEAVYKWQGRRGVEFIEHLPIEKVEKTDHNLNITIFTQLTSPKQKIIAKSFIEADFSCALVYHAFIFHPFNTQ